MDWAVGTPTLEFQNGEKTLSAIDTSVTVEKSTAEIFQELFAGSPLSHGVLANGDHHTEDGAATPADYENHLRGIRGLGIVPVRLDGTCQFAAIDIDVDTIKSAKFLVQKVRFSRGLQDAAYGLP